MSTITGWSFSEGEDLFRGAPDCDGIEGIFTFLDHNILITIARVERFRDYVCGYFFWNTGEPFRKFFNQNFKKRYKTQK